MKTVSPLTTIRRAAKEFNYEGLLTRDKGGKIGANKMANSGEQFVLDLPRLAFEDPDGKDVIVVNGKKLVCNLVKDKAGNTEKVEIILDNEKKSSITPGDKSYFELAREIWKQIFKASGESLPDNKIIDELIRNFHQAGYVGALVLNVFNRDFMEPLLQANTHCSRDESEIKIDCINSQSITLEIKEKEILKDLITSDRKGDISSSVKFTIESTENGVKYKDGELSLKASEELKSIKLGQSTLFDMIVELFNKLCEKLGFPAQDTEIHRNLGKGIESIPPKELERCAHGLKDACKEYECNNKKHLDEPHAQQVPDSRERRSGDHTH